MLLNSATPLSANALIDHEMLLLGDSFPDTDTLHLVKKNLSSSAHKELNKICVSVSILFVSAEMSLTQLRLQYVLLKYEAKQLSDTLAILTQGVQI